MTPVVLRHSKFDVVIYTKDHTPAHVHVKRAEKEARITLSPVEVMSNIGFKPGEITSILKFIQSHQDELLAKWEEFHS